jgi:hypothetical protein
VGCINTHFYFMVSFCISLLSSPLVSLSRWVNCCVGIGGSGCLGGDIEGTKMTEVSSMQ